jgi:hypothetical protein
MVKGMPNLFAILPLGQNSNDRAIQITPHARKLKKVPHGNGRLVILSRDNLAAGARDQSGQDPDTHVLLQETN